MDDQEFLAARFDDHRAHLRAVAYRMLGSPTEADDAVQEAWVRLSRTDASEVENLGGWLTTVVSRVCLDMLRARTSRRESPLEAPAPTPPLSVVDPEREAEVADSVGLAMLVVLDTLAPAERLAFVLHDMFAVPFDEIAPIVGRSPEATRQLASRARRRVQGAPASSEADVARQRAVVEAFLAASRGGDFAALLELLDPDIVLRADEASMATGAEREVSGARAVAEVFSGRARAAQPAIIDGGAGLAWAPGGRARVVFAMTISNGKVTAIDMVADTERIGAMELVLLDG
ncbi:MAG: sigma-70 family RNA polymerase sigma factor [Acidimicrobiia bacterium]|nr:sigma-70 family RNA polymerase sigma factor [Acidimicrobiia bacterium]